MIILRTLIFAVRMVILAMSQRIFANFSSPVTYDVPFFQCRLAYLLPIDFVSIGNSPVLLRTLGNKEMVQNELSAPLTS